MSQSSPSLPNPRRFLFVAVATTILHCDASLPCIGMRRYGLVAAIEDDASGCLTAITNATGVQQTIRVATPFPLVRGAPGATLVSLLAGRSVSHKLAMAAILHDAHCDNGEAHGELIWKNAVFEMCGWWSWD
ncbi:hypothetical protein EV126DRAFT_58900 [Verticillium dahliae]|nr:hypothetical protein EV126DRAFT_58900 [Verticillium dahliae]